MATNNAINNASYPLATTALTVDPGSSADSWVQFNINTTNEFRIGQDQSASSAFTIASGAALGTSNALVVATGGSVTLPTQPAVLVMTTRIDNVTGDGTTYTVMTSGTSEIFDQGNNFSAPTWTAPVTGLYFIQMTCTIYNQLSSGTELTIAIVTSNRSYTMVLIPERGRIANFYGPNTSITYSTSAVYADMDSADTSTITMTASGGSKVQDVGQDGYVNFALIC